MVASGLRSLLIIGPGPDDGGSRLNRRPHMPDRSGMDTLLFVSLFGGAVRVSTFAQVRASQLLLSLTRSIRESPGACACPPPLVVHQRDRRKPYGCCSEAIGETPKMAR